MREVFHQSLEDVQARLVEIAELVTTAVEGATRAFGTSDVALAEEIIEADAVIDGKAAEIDELAIQILARQQPVARDLRIVVAALRVSASLERMGDIAEHIAQLTRMRFPERAIPKGLKGTFTKMGELDVEVARTLSELLRTEDLALVETLRALPNSQQAAIIGRVTPDFSGRVVLRTEIGTRTLLPEPSGELLPRIC